MKIKGVTLAVREMGGSAFNWAMSLHVSVILVSFFKSLSRVFAKGRERERKKGS